MFKGEFKTARLQREVPMDAIVVDDLVVGELVKVTPSAGSMPAIVEKLVAETVAAAKEEASHIMAQSDMTLGYGHVPVEVRDYRYSDEIASGIDMEKVEGVGITFHGIYASSESLPSSSATVSSNDTALVLDSNGVKLEKYVATVQSTTVTWAKATSTAAYSVNLIDAVKKVAAYKILNVDDLIVVDED